MLEPISFAPTSSTTSSPTAAIGTRRSVLEPVRARRHLRLTHPAQATLTAPLLAAHRRPRRRRRLLTADVSIGARRSLSRPNISSSDTRRCRKPALYGQRKHGRGSPTGFAKGDYPSKSRSVRDASWSVRTTCTAGRTSSMVTMTAGCPSRFESFRGALLMSTSCSPDCHLGRAHPVSLALTRTCAFVLCERDARRPCVCASSDLAVGSRRSKRVTRGARRQRATRLHVGLGELPVRFRASPSPTGCIRSAICVCSWLLPSAMYRDSQGLNTGDNDRFVRLWPEVQSHGSTRCRPCQLRASAARWFPLQQGRRLQEVVRESRLRSRLGDDGTESLLEQRPADARSLPTTTSSTASDRHLPGPDFWSRFSLRSVWTQRVHFDVRAELISPRVERAVAILATLNTRLSRTTASTLINSNR